MMNNLKITFIGGGNMGTALVSGIIKSGYPKELVAVADQDQQKLAKLKDTLGIATYTDNFKAVEHSDVIVLAVKPQVMEQMLTDLTASLKDYGNRLIISMAAGITVDRLKTLTKGHEKVIRLMPNTPALIGQGVTGMYASACVSADEKDFANQILSSVSKTVWVQREEDMNTITAASGSSPAYFFIFMQYMIEHCVELGLTQEQAYTLVTQAALGSAQLVMQSPQVSLETLRAQVTSKGGTTYAAICSFEEMNLKQLVNSAMDACVARAKEMEKLF